VTRVSKSGKNHQSLLLETQTFEKMKTLWRKGDLYLSGKYTCILIMMYYSLHWQIGVSLSPLFEWVVEASTILANALCSPTFFPLSAPSSPPPSWVLCFTAYLWVLLWALIYRVVRFLTIPPFKCVFQSSSPFGSHPFLNAPLSSYLLNSTPSSPIMSSL